VGAAGSGATGSGVVQLVKDNTVEHSISECCVWGDFRGMSGGSGKQGSNEVI
jgi:hypothetical protein